MKVDDKYFDEIFDFAGQWDMPSKCGLKILNSGEKVIVVVTELYQDNPGTSVTYAGGSLIKQICDAKNLSINNIVYLECNPNTNSKLSFYDEEIFKVDYELENGLPVNLKYKQLSQEEVKTLLS
ncbi:MAG: hypothetical protein PHU62_03200 [Bacteroidales bacterium]|jgi:hypothetical protein|nr:hypothetical protein [Bacteroidales bacterium]MDD2204140.1 hypothetical protein [Bacteroidales bacterium]MDD3152149.1 hypothetical protein [Bacteroidales bacterium]MDD3913804.1 hypothetical protein [Bacteroidales bacterium]MDD4633569.1 hypothetical protein [Bacteroidales bacterium]